MGTTRRGGPAAGAGRDVSAGPLAGHSAGAPRYAEVLVDQTARELDRSFTYRVPPELAARLAIGSRVLVPFGRQRLAGYVVGFTAEPPAVQLKSIFALLADAPLFDEEQLSLARWVAERYRCSLQEALRGVLTPGSARVPLVTVSLTEAGRAARADQLGRARRQGQVLATLQAVGGEANLNDLVAQAGGATRSAVVSALRSLEKKGWVTQQRELRPPQARGRMVQAVEIAVVGDQTQIVEELARRAPRQAEALRALRAAEGPLRRLRGCNWCRQPPDCAYRAAIPAIENRRGPSNLRRGWQSSSATLPVKRISGSSASTMTVRSPSRRTLLIS